jgi:hypothetical protein
MMFLDSTNALIAFFMSKVVLLAYVLLPTGESFVQYHDRLESGAGQAVEAAGSTYTRG